MKWFTSIGMAMLGTAILAGTPQAAPQITGKVNPAHFSMTKNLAALAMASKQRGEALQVNFHEEYGTPRFMTGKLTNPSDDQPKDIALRFVTQQREVLKLAKETTFSVAAENRDDLGHSHVRLRLYKQGLEIWPAEMMLHMDKGGVIYAANGIYRDAHGLDLQPALSPSAAVEKALADQDFSVPYRVSTQLLIYDWQVTYPLLAYRVHIEAENVYPLNQDVFVDAVNGTVINIIDRIQSSERDSHANDKAGVTVTVFPNLENNNTASAGAYQDGSQIYLIDTSKSMFSGTLDPNTLAGTIFTLDANHTDTSNGASLAQDLNGDLTINDSDEIRAAGAAHYWMGGVYDWLLQTFNRNSFDGNGSALKIFVNFRENNAEGLDNAFWTGKELVFGDGGTFFYNLAYGADVAAHELCHAINDSTAALIYQFQSGALNESFSDVYASLFDDDDWLIGETIVRPNWGAPALRSMQDPNQGLSNGQNGWQPRHMNEFQNLTAQQDNGGVHVNSGIPNWAFYKLATAIGRGDAGAIMNRALTTYLTRNSQFEDMRSAAKQAATDLFGASSNQAGAVDTAYTEVGIGATTPPSPGTATHVLYYPFVAPFSIYGRDYGNAFFISNPSDTTANITVIWLGSDGTQTFASDAQLSPGATSWSFGETSDQWVKVTSDQPIIGAYQHMSATGDSWSLIPATQFINNGIFVPHIATNTQKFWTVGAFANAVDTPSSLIYVDNVSPDGLALEIDQVGMGVAFDFEATYTQIFGAFPPSGTTAAGGLWGLAANFDLQAGRVLDFNLVGAEIFGRKDVAQSAGLIMDATSGRTLYFTHVAGNTTNFWTGYSLVNISDPNLGTIPVRIVAYDNSGNETANTIVDLPPFGKLLRITGDELVPAGTSWFLVSAQREGASLNGMELFGSNDDRMMAGFQATPLVATRFFFPVVFEGTTGLPTVFDGMNVGTSFSVLNPNERNTTVSVTVHRFDGSSATMNTTLGPNSKFITLVKDLFGTNFFGYLEINATQPVSGFSLSYHSDFREWAANPMVLLE